MSFLLVGPESFLPSNERDVSLLRATQLLLNGFVVVLMSTVFNGSDISITNPVVVSWLIYHVCLCRAWRAEPPHVPITLMTVQTTVTRSNITLRIVLQTTLYQPKQIYFVFGGMCHYKEKLTSINLNNIKYLTDTVPTEHNFQTTRQKMFKQ